MKRPSYLYFEKCATTFKKLNSIKSESRYWYLKRAPTKSSKPSHPFLLIISKSPQTHKSGVVLSIFIDFHPFYQLVKTFTPTYIPSQKRSWLSSFSLPKSRTLSKPKSTSRSFLVYNKTKHNQPLTLLITLEPFIKDILLERDY